MTQKERQMAAELTPPACSEEEMSAGASSRPRDAQRGLHSAEMAHEPVLWLSYVS